MDRLDLDDCRLTVGCPHGSGRVAGLALGRNNDGGGNERRLQDLEPRYRCRLADSVHRVRFPELRESQRTLVSDVTEESSCILYLGQPSQNLLEIGASLLLPLGQLVQHDHLNRSASGECRVVYRLEDLLYETWLRFACGSERTRTHVVDSSINVDALVAPSLHYFLSDICSNGLGNPSSRFVQDVHEMILESPHENGIGRCERNPHLCNLAMRGIGSVVIEKDGPLVDRVDDFPTPLPQSFGY